MVERFESPPERYTDRKRRRPAVSRPLVVAVALVVLATGVSLASPLRAVAQGSTACGSTPSGSILAGGTASAWACQGDLLGVLVTDGNGGAAANSTFSSSSLAISEECLPSPNQHACGRGEFGYGGGELPFGSVLIDAQDSTQNPNGDQFACPSTPSGTSAQTSTETGASGSGHAPALAYHTGNFAGGRVTDGLGTGGSVSQDTECYTPYEQCTAAPTGDTTETPSIPNAQFCSAANASNNVPGKAYLADPSPEARDLNAAFYVPNATGNGSSCNGKIVVAGGQNSSGTELTDAYAYDPRYNNGTNSAHYNQWALLSSSLSAARDTMDVVQLSATKWLLAGGETLTAASNAYDIFDSTTCAFTGGTLPTARYDFGMAKFGGFGTDVLACGGTHDFVNFTALSSCDLYNATAGTWATQTSGLLHGRNGVFGQFLPTGTILMASSETTAGVTTDSEECTENARLHVLVSCGVIASYDRNSSDVGFDTSRAFLGIGDSSHVLLGCIATENACNTAGYSSSSLDPAVLECGGFNATGNGSASGFDTEITCEYYVPATKKIPSFFSTGKGTFSCHDTLGPTWCTTPSTHMNRERAYFNLSEFPALSGTPTGGTQATSDEFKACGGFYGEANGTTFTPFLVRKNCEGLTKPS